MILSVSSVYNLPQQTIVSKITKILTDSISRLVISHRLTSVGDGSCHFMCRSCSKCTCTSKRTIAGQLFEPLNILMRQSSVRFRVVRSRIRPDCFALKSTVGDRGARAHVCNFKTVCNPVKSAYSCLDSST